MPPTPCVMRPSYGGFYLLQEQYFATAKRKCLGSGWFCVTSTSIRPGQPCRLPSVPQIRFASNNNKGWYDWYKRLRVDPKASEKDLRNAYRKRAKVEHPDVDKTPGAKERFQNASSILQETYENLCNESKRKQHDRERIVRQNAAAAEAARTMASQPSVADSLRAKWKAADELSRKAEDMRTRQIRKTAQAGPADAFSHKRREQPAKPEKKHRPEAGSQMPKDPKSESYEQEPHKQQTRQTQPEETEEDRMRKKKVAEDARAKKRTAVEAQKIKADAAAERVAENNRLQERVIIIRGLLPETKLADVFDLFVELAPGAIFRAKLWPNNVAEIEFCTDIAARKVLAGAKERQLFIKGECVTNVELGRSKNELPVLGHKSRVLGLYETGTVDITVKKESVAAFLTKFGLQVVRVVKHTLSESRITSTTVHFASWTDAERAMRLLAKHLPHVNVSYRSDPCGMEPEIKNAYEIAGRIWRYFHSKKMEKEWDIAFVLVILFLILIAAELTDC